MPDEDESAHADKKHSQTENTKNDGDTVSIEESSKAPKDAPDRDSSATKGSAGTRPPSDS